MSLILCLSGISMGPYCRKSLAKRGDGDWKKYKKGTWPYRGGVYRRRGFKPSAHYARALLCLSAK